MAESTATASPAVADARTRRENQRSWFGYLADDNVEHVAARMRRLLDGRRFTFVTSNAEMGVNAWSPPEVKTGQRLEHERATSKNALRVGRKGAGEEFCIITAVITDYVWSVLSSHATEHDARAAADDAERRKHTTYLNIEGGAEWADPRDGGRIEIRQYNGPGEMLHWVLATERPDPGRLSIEEPWIGNEWRRTPQFLVDAAWKVRAGYSPGGSTVTSAVAALLEDVARQMDPKVRTTYDGHLPATHLRGDGVTNVNELTFEERQQLPAIYHRPVFCDLADPVSWICAVCWDEGVTHAWPCRAATEGGSDLAKHLGLEQTR